MSKAIDDLGAEPRSQLLRESVSLGAASMAGRLYDLGDYPGMVDTSDPAQIVHGEIIELHAPDVTFPWLDHYEGIDHEHPHLSDYERKILGVSINGRSTSAWVYIYRGITTPEQLVASGRWLKTK